jgi:uncharacterized protein (TIGR00730 family)
MLAARRLGVAMSKRRIHLVYGGGRAGLMGEIADSVLAGGGVVTGIITRQLMDKELGHTGVQSLKIVDTMHERKKAMADTARGFVALPGGVGTLDELFEIIAWAQLGIHEHPVGLLNVDGFYDDLLRWLKRADADKFLRVAPADALIVDTDADALLDKMAARGPLQRRRHGEE